MVDDGSAERPGRQPGAEPEAGSPGMSYAGAGARWWHVVPAWLAGTAIAYTLASVAHTQTILAGLDSLGVDVSPGTRLATTGSDLIGLWAYAVVIGIGLASGLVILRLLPSPIRPRSRVVRGALAGTLAIATALLAMRLAASFTPIASARGPIGFALQCLAGTAGGLTWAFVLSRLAARPARPARLP